MRTPFVVSSLTYLALVGAIACSSDGGDGGSGGGAQANACEGLGEVSFDPSTSCAGKCAPVNDDYCADNGVKGACLAGAIDACGVSLPLPPKEGNVTVLLTRSESVKEYGGKGAPDLSCFDADSLPPPPDTAASKLVKLKGIVKIFSNGCESKNLTIAVHKVIRSGGADDGMPGDLVGAAVTTPASCKDVGVPEENEKCGTRYECTYEYPNVPSETELMVVTNGEIWAPIYEYGLFIRNAEVKDGTFEKDVRALASDDYQLIPQVALGKTITAGNGALAGEVHDCGDVRLVDAIVDIDQPKFSLSYFTDNEENPLPNIDAHSTSTLGLYSALDVKPGPVNVAAAGVLDGKLVSLGYFRARVFPDAVTSFTFRGLRPFQVASK
ncbi:MAG: hypothetical protein FJ096_10785 [Deltaproteobacteria bacterium]|nr:hypothetical protein [Deltaproteobacteria bacterium]